MTVYDRLVACASSGRLVVATPVSLHGKRGVHVQWMHLTPEASVLAYADCPMVRAAFTIGLAIGAAASARRAGLEAPA